jgi:hypothetical protein
MQKNIDYIYVPKADINEGISSGVITKAALYFTKDFMFVIPFESLEILLAGVETKNQNLKDYVSDLNKQIPDLDIDSFHSLLLSLLKPERIYKISELEKFSIQVGFWIFGGIQIRRKNGPLQAFNVQPKLLREEIKQFYSSNLQK